METKNSGILNHWAVAAHLVPFAGAIIPLLSVAAPFILYKVLQPNQTFAKQHARASFNFQATFFALTLVAIIPIVILQILVRQKIAVTFFAFLTLLIGAVMIIAGIYALVAMIKNAIRASRDLPPEYRFSYPFLK